MMNEQKFFLRILSDFIDKKNTCNDQEYSLDWKVLSDIVRRHQLTGIFFKQCKNILPDDMRNTFQKSYAAQVYYFINRKQKIDSLLQEFDRKSISFFVVKGEAIASLYPVPALRSMGDVDIMIKKEDQSIVHQIMLDVGYTNVTQGETVWNYKYNELEIEIHNKLINAKEKHDADLGRYFEKCWDWVIDGELNWNFHFIYILVHLRKHLINSGVGFRQFMDLALIVKNIDLDWAWIKDELEEIDLMQFFQVVMAFLKRWFNVELPIDIDSIDENFYNTATDKIFKNGVFGFDNEENKQATIINTSMNKGRFGQIDLVLKQVFPSYKDMKKVPCYSFLNGKPYLLPIAWIYRLYRGRKKMNTGINAIKSCFVSNEKIEKREQMYKQWGL